MEEPRQLEASTWKNVNVRTRLKRQTGGFSLSANYFQPFTLC